MLYVKALHIIFVVTWFAGLFYLVRLLVYHTEAQQRPEPERNILSQQFALMERKLWNIITAPSAVIAVGTGLYLAHLQQVWVLGWLHVKLTLVALLVLYHGRCWQLMRAQLRGVFMRTSVQLRFFNEGATVLLVSIVFLVVVKDTLHALAAFAGFMALVVVLTGAIVLANRQRLRGKAPRS